jgi:transposase
MNADKYVGLDVHKATTVVAMLDSDGTLVQQTIVATQTETLREFFSAMKGRVRVALEEGVHAAWLFDLLAPLVTQVLVANPRELPSRKARNKNDKSDALLLARLLRSGDLTAVYHGEHGTRTLKQLARHYAALVDDCTSVMNRIKAVYRGLGIACSGSSVYASTRRQEWLAKLENDGVRFRVSALLEQLDALRALRKKAQAALVREVRRHSAFKRLTTLPGLGPVRVAQLIAILDTPHRFRTKRQLWAYAGLAVQVHESDEYRLEAGRVTRARARVRTRGLNKNGNRRLKHLLKSAAATASWQGPLSAWYQQRIAGGMAKELAQVSLARKLAAIALAVWKSGEGFDAKKVTNPTP